MKLIACISFFFYQYEIGVVGSWLLPSNLCSPAASGVALSLFRDSEGKEEKVFLKLQISVISVVWINTFFYIKRRSTNIFADVSWNSPSSHEGSCALKE